MFDLKMATFFRPEPDLRSLRMDSFQTWYNHRTCLGAYACHLIFELRSMMTAWWPSLFSKWALWGHISANNGRRDPVPNAFHTKSYMPDPMDT